MNWWTRNISSNLIQRRIAIPMMLLLRVNQVQILMIILMSPLPRLAVAFGVCGAFEGQLYGNSILCKPEFCPIVSFKLLKPKIKLKAKAASGYGHL